MQFGSRAAWEFAIEHVAQALGLLIVVGRTGVRIPVSGDVDGFRVRCRFEDDPVRQPSNLDKLFCRVVEVPYRKLARIERELKQRAPWSPYPVGNGSP